MVEAEARLPGVVERLVHAVEGGEDLARRGQGAIVLRVDVGHLVVGHGEGAARVRVERLADGSLAHRQEPGLAQGPVHVHGLRHRLDAVLAHDDRRGTDRVGAGHQLADQGVHLPHRLRERSAAGPKRWWS